MRWTLVFILLFARPLFAAPPTLPVVTTAQFQIGQTWTWDYFDAKGAIYSTEIYQVIETHGAEITFAMSSAYNGSQKFNTHHRLKANLNRCLNAHRNPADPKPWSIELFYLDEHGTWTSSGITAPLAFEEKFNCNPHPQATRWQYEVEYAQRAQTPSTLFHHRRKSGRQSSWFDLSGDNAGVAREKDFLLRGKLNYRFIRRSCSHLRPGPTGGMGKSADCFP